MKVGVLTSSRADFGIYLPLLQYIRSDSFFDLNLIVFGSHLLQKYGHTVKEIEAHGFINYDKVLTPFEDDTPKGIAISYANTCTKFSNYWGETDYDLVFCLGDRFEMQAAVQAGIPQRVNFAHIHGGETTEGAIDNIYRHQITLASNLHFVSTASYAIKVKQIIGSEEKVYQVGALSLDGLRDLDLPDLEKVKGEFNMLSLPYILVTFHPETVSINKNREFADEMFEALYQLSQSNYLVITLPNADTLGSLYREKLNKLNKEVNITLVDNFGKLNYFTVMKHAMCLLGNTSSGIIEAASFGKYVVNVGNRQKGRMQSENTLNARFNTVEIVNAVEKIKNKKYAGQNVYYKSDVAQTIVNKIKEIENEGL